ncbi:MAG: hypothetical protein AABZ55_00560 [Bdellovibrionota bacterium]
MPMKKVHAVVTGLVFSLALQGCGAMPQSDDSTAVDVSQFIYKANVTDHGVEYSYLCAQKPLRSIDSQTFYYRLEIYARESGTYVLLYREFTQDESGSAQITRSLDLNGTWQLVDNKMEFSDLGEGTGAKFENHPSLGLKIIRNSKNSAIAPGMPMLSKCVGNTGVE